MRFLLLAFLSLFSVTGPLAQTRNSQPLRDDHVLIQRRRVVLRRPRQIAKEFPERKIAVVTYPVVSGLSDAAVLRKVRAALAFKNIFDYSLNEYRDDAWLIEFGYLVNYNSNYMLDITFTQSGMGAYPDEQSKHFLISLRDGSVVKAADVFEPDKLAALAALVNRKLQSELKQIAVENSRGADAEEKESLMQAYEPLKFEVSNLDDFSVGRKGVTFLYDAGFPHVIQAWEPNGRYFFSYAALREFIKRDGLLGRFKG
ncbi:MAG: hypothetical protein QOD75_2364 [Blastocatellia bacterium]|nr:hypothetical protein [Blastocatellia bacterium]